MAGRSIFDPQVPAGAYDEFVVEAAPRSAAQRGWEPSDGPLPALYIGHGAPPLLDDALWMSQLAAWTHTHAQAAGGADRLRALGGGAADAVGAGGRDAAGVRLRRVPAAVLHADLRDAGRFGARARGGVADALDGARAPASLAWP